MKQIAKQPQRYPTSRPSSQHGASITTILVLIIALGLLAKFGVATIPDYISNYQLNKMVADELKRANTERWTEKQFLEALDRQLSINANYNTKAADVITVKNKTPGSLAVRVAYEKENLYFKNTYIVNRFDKQITASDATQ